MSNVKMKLNDAGFNRAFTSADGSEIWQPGFEDAGAKAIIIAASGQIKAGVLGIGDGGVSLIGENYNTVEDAVLAYEKL